MKTIFNKLIVDSPEVVTAGIGRIINVFSETDIDRISVDGNCYPRLFDISLLEKLGRYPIIISHHIDLLSVSKLSHPAGLAIEVANKQDILEAAKFTPDLLITKSFESSGVSKECSALVLFQLLINQNTPFSMYANTGLELFQAYLSAGVYGIVLPLKYLQDETTPTLRFNLDTLTSLRLEVEGGPVNAHSYQQQLKEKESLDFIAQSYQSGWWEKSLQLERRQFIQQKLTHYKSILGYKTYFVKQSYFFPHALAAQALNVSLPIVQGPMSGITISADFAQEIYQQGAFPFLALAGLANDFVEKIVAETAQKSINFGVGIVAVSLSDEDFEQQIETFERYQPKLVLVGTPQLNHIERLLKSDLNIAVHAPNRALFKSLYQMGIRRFVIEGEEAGGHISNLGSLTAWQDIFNEIREQSLQDKVHIILAGGIKGKAAKDLISALLYYYGFENNLKISLQLGTAYLASKEAVALTPLSQGFQKQLLTVNDTLVTGESLSRRVRQLAIKNAEQNIAKEWRIFNSDKSHQDKKKEYEALYHGGLQRAIASDLVVESGSYMAGSVSALLDEQVDIKAIHADLIDPAPTHDNSEQPEPIAIVGIGLKLPGAESVAEHFYNIFHQRCFITDLPEDHFNREIYLSADKGEELTSYTALGALINKLDDDLSRYRIPPIIATQLSRSQKMALDVAHKALEDANYFARPFNKARTGVIIGTGGGSNEDSLSKIDWPELRSRLMTLSEKEGINLEGILDEYESLFFSKEITADTRPGELANIIASRIASVFDFKGEAYTVEAACAASLAAIAHAMTSLRNRSCDVVLAGGVEERMGKDTYIEFSRIGAVSENGCFGLDSKADGFVLGEGAAMFVLKRYSDALRFGDKIYAVFNGWGASSDGAGKAITAPNKEGQIKAVKRAFQNAQLSPSLVDYIECHATSTKVGDSTELEGLIELFQHNRGKKPVLGASKTMVGHLRCGAGAVGVLQSLFVINNRRFPATINFQTPSSGNELPFTLLKQSKKVEHDDRIYSSVSAFGFGGTNFHLVLSSPEENITEPILSEQMMDLPVYQFSGDLAWVCPGQGSQYEGMLAAYKNSPELSNLSGQIRSTFEEFSSIDLLALLTEIDADNQAKNEALLKSTEMSQAAIFLTSIIIGKKLLNLGIRPDLLIGHSLGEYSALCLANILSFADAFRMVCIRGRIMSAAMVDDAGTMIAVMANETVAKKIIESTRHYAACANLNAYDQTVISCSEEAVKDILKAADELKIRATQLKVARGFHSRFVSHCVDEMAKALQTCEFSYPDNLVTANIKNQAYPFDPKRRRQVMSQADRQRSISLLKQQVDHPVHFINQIQAAYVSGVRRFIEVGPNNILSRLIEQIHQGKYLQTIYLNKQGEEGFDLDSLKTLLQQEIAIKRIPLPVRQTTHKKNAKPKAAASNAAEKYSAIDEIRHVVVTVSGYEPGSFDDNAEFERDLGIDTLKIFEILAQLRGNVLPEELGNFRELNSVNKILAACPVKDQPQETALSSPLDQIREIVAKVSGYPLHNLDDHAEFERDLGIDTLKIFEIIAQLRGTLLPDELTDFRNLNSIQKLYAARDKSHEVAVQTNNTKKELFVYKYKEHVTEDYTLAAISLNDFEIHADNGWSHTVTDSKQHLFIFKVADSVEDLRHRVYQLLFAKTREFIQANTRQIIYLSYGTGPLQEASYLSVSAFVRSVTKDFSQALCHYNHFDRLPDENSIANQVIAGIGLQSTTGSIMQGKLQKQHGFQTDLSQISTQLSAKDHIVVTGGARGIAAHLVKKLYANCQARFTLIGRKQPIEDWITKLDDQRIKYLAIDVSDKAAVEKFLYPACRLHFINTCCRP